MTLEKGTGYETPQLRRLGTFASLTKGSGGSCTDGNNVANPTQHGGGNPGTGVPCGPGKGPDGNDDI